MASSSSKTSSPKSKVEKFLAASWFNLLKRDDQLKKKLKETVMGRTKASRKTKKNSKTSNIDVQKRGRPISELGWLPPGWERITKSRASGQKDTFYREIQTNRTMRSSYDVTSYLEFGRVIKKNKGRVKSILEAKYGLKFPKERRKEIVLMEASLAETSDNAVKDQEEKTSIV